jgi:hypothetical protein
MPRRPFTRNVIGNARNVIGNAWTTFETANLAIHPEAGAASDATVSLAPL